MLLFKPRYVAIVVAMVMVTSAWCQHKWNPLDSIRLASNKVPGFRLGLDGRSSFLYTQRVNLAGARYGLDFGKIGVFTGIYASVLSKRRINQDSIAAGFNYVSSTLEYYIYQSWRYEVCVPVQMGFGWGNTTVITTQGEKKYREWNFVPVEIGISGTVRVLRYFGVVGGFGYRKALFGSNKFDAPYYSFGLTYFTGTMYKDAKKFWKEKVRK